jgi:hypothetical protein
MPDLSEARKKSPMHAPNELHIIVMRPKRFWRTPPSAEADGKPSKQRSHK